VTSLRARLLAVNPLIWVALVYACGVGIRLIYTLSIQPPEAFIYSDMGLYVGWRAGSSPTSRCPRPT